MTQTHAQNSPHAPVPSSAEYKAIVEAARAPAARELKQTIGLDPDALNVAGDWAFLTANIVDASGAPFDYHGTRLEEAAQAGGVSRLYAGLLQRRDGHWIVVTRAIGPTDVAWESWASEFGAPAALFGTD
jgi:hypothetical protein